MLSLRVTLKLSPKLITINIFFVHLILLCLIGRDYCRFKKAREVDNLAVIPDTTVRVLFRSKFDVVYATVTNDSAP